MKQLINIILAFFLFHTSAALAAELKISCNLKRSIDGYESQKIYVFNLEKLSARDVTVIPPRLGVLLITDNFYQINFSETEKVWAITAVINRYSGEFKGEKGSPPFGTYKKGNYFLNGKCEKTENRKLF